MGLNTWSVARPVFYKVNQKGKNIYIQHLHYRHVCVTVQHVISKIMLVIRYLVFDEKSALWWMRKVGSGPLHHQFEDCIRWGIVQIAPP